MNTVAIIPARGGSKGIPRKNFIPFNGRPLIYWNIKAAQEAELVDQVMVSTDDPGIAAVSEAAGATVIVRPDKISTDIASSEDALLHALECIGKEPELMVFLQCTSPLTQSEDIDNCIRKLIDNNADSAFTATESHRFLWKNSEKATGVNHDGAERKRRQDLEQEYAENGAVYVMRTAGFLQSRHRFFGKTVISEMPASRSWEIDTPEDILVAEALSIAAHGKTALPQTVEAVVFDFDGVMTDNAVYISEDGKESVRCSRSDGWGISRLRNAGIRMAVMSTEENPVVQARCKKLKLECFHQLGNKKIDRLTAWSKEHNIDMANTVYVGNDENDVECLLAAGAGAAPCDAHKSAQQVADVLLTRHGGKDAVRELCDMILERIEK
ncbi:MAG: acylneuraminate cytidylyltransferase [Thermodesulfobacteriota bacterium]